MKVVAKPVDMVAWFDKEGIPHPVRFRIINEDNSNMVIKVDRVVTREVEKLAGNNMIVFNCFSEISGVGRAFQLKYELKSCRLVLFKI